MTSKAGQTPVFGVQAHPGGLFRRAISLDHRGPGRVVGWLEDHYHHFGVTIDHAEGHVRDVRMAAPRFPWATCAGAAVPLRALVGQPLITRASDLGRLIDMRLQCTHVFDLVALALVQAATGRPDRTYEVQVPDRAVTVNPDAANAAEINLFGPGEVSLLRDGERVMHWSLDGQTITGPDPYGGHSLAQGFRQWTETMPEEEAEHATIIRRALLVAGGRYQDLDVFPTSAAQNMPAACHSFQPGQRDVAFRLSGSDRNYETAREAMLAHRAVTP
jgi:hypothetical protein